MFILQLEGHKNWEVFEPPADLPMEKPVRVRPELFTHRLPFDGRASLSAAKGQVPTQIRLERGDFLYVPRGFSHRAWSGDDEPSMHLTVEIRAFTWHELFAHAIVRHLPQDVALRRGLPPGFATDPERVEEAVGRRDELMAAVRAALAPDRLEAAVEDLANRYVHSRNPVSRGQLADLAQAARIDAGTRLRVRPGVTARLVESGGKLVLLFSGNALELPERSRSMVEFILAERRFAAGELPHGAGRREPSRPRPPPPESRLPRPGARGGSSERAEGGGRPHRDRYSDQYSDQCCEYGSQAMTNETFFGLDRLLAPVSASDFTNTYWESRMLHLERGEPGYYRDLLGLADVDRVLATGKDHPEFTVALIQDGVIVHQDGDHVRRFGHGDALRVERLDTQSIYAHHAAGATIRVYRLERHLTPVWSLAADLERQLSAEVSVNLYLTPPGSQGFRVHQDLHDVLVLQVEGESAGGSTSRNRSCRSSAPCGSTASSMKTAIRWNGKPPPRPSTPGRCGR